MKLPLKYDSLSKGEDGAFNKVVRLYDEKVGWIYTTRTGRRVQLDDIHINEQPTQPGPWECPPKLRGTGIGSDLLGRFLAWADSHNVVEIWGEVTEDDITDNRDLLGWYRRHGFEVQEPDVDCTPDVAAKKIVRLKPD